MALTRKRKRKKSPTTHEVSSRKKAAPPIKIIVAHYHQHLFATEPNRYPPKELKKLLVILAEKFPSTENYNVFTVPQ